MEISMCALLAVLCVLCGVSAAREEEGSGEDQLGSGSGSGSDPPLSGEAIANITASVLGISVIGAALCYLMLCFNKDSRLQRVRMAQERNRQITRQIEAAKQKKRAQQLAGSGQLETSREEEKRSAGNLLFSQAHRSHEEGGESRDTESNPTEPLVPSSHSPTS